MKHYRATPVRGTPGDPITAHGLPALVALAKEQYGLVSNYESVRAKVYRADENNVFRGRDGMWLEISHDPEADAAYEIAQTDAKLNDDRAQDYMANVYVTSRSTSGEDAVEYSWERVRAKGLLNLIGEAVQLTAPLLGGVPPGLEFEAVKQRLPNMRTQMVKSRKVKPQYSVAFPPSPEYWTAPKTNWETRIYIDIAAEYVPPAEIKTFQRRD